MSYQQFYQYHHRGTTTAAATSSDVAELETVFKASLGEMSAVKASSRGYVVDLARDFSVLQSTKDQSVTLQGAVAIDAARVDRAAERAALVVERGDLEGDAGDHADDAGDLADANGDAAGKLVAEARAHRAAASAAVSAFVLEKKKLDVVTDRADAYLPEGRDTVDRLAHAAQDHLDAAGMAFREIGMHARGVRTAAVDVPAVKRLYATMVSARERLDAMRATHAEATPGMGVASNESLEGMRRHQNSLEAAADKMESTVAAAAGDELPMDGEEVEVEDAEHVEAEATSEPGPETAPPVDGHAAGAIAGRPTLADRARRVLGDWRFVVVLLLILLVVWKNTTDSEGSNGEGEPQ